MSATASNPTSEREQITAMLRESQQTYLRTLSGIPESAASARLDDDGWSILEIAEHVAAAEHGMFRAIELATEKTTPPDYSFDARIVAAQRDRSAKRNAPDPSRPKGRWKTLAEAADAFNKSRERSIELAGNVENLRGRLIQHPLAGPIDGYQCLLIMATHPERHAEQIKERMRKLVK
jgi:hypothetical protein